jgi:DNA-binding IclR family transcriptional regulator
VNEVRNLEPTRSPRTGRSVPAVERAVLVLRTLSEAGSGLRLSELARLLDLSKSSLSDLLFTLEQEGLVERDPGSRAFRLGHTLVGLGMAATGGLDLARAARPALTALRDLTAETTILHIPTGPEALVVDAVESAHQLKVVAPVGHRLPAFAGSVAKVLLAWRPADQRDAAVAAVALPAFTPRSITDAGAYLAELDRARAAGYATDDEEYLPGVRAASAPVLDHTGRTVGTLSVVAVASRVTRKRLREIGPQLAGEATAVSRRLGAGATLTEDAVAGAQQ